MQLRLPQLRPKSIVGLDIGSSSIKAVELASTSKGLELTHLGTAKLPAEAIVQGALLNSGAIVEATREAIASGRIKTKDVAAAVSGHSVIVKKVSLPAMTSEELEESIRWEAEQYIPFDVNEVNLDFQILSGASEAEGQMDVLLVAAKRDLIDDYTQVIRDAGLNPVIMDVAAFAVENAFEANYTCAPDEMVALVNIGAQVVNINILVGGVPAFTRDIATGGNQYTEEIQKALSISFDEAERIKMGGSLRDESQEVVPQEVEEAIRTVTEHMVAEIARSLDFFTATAAEGRIHRVYLCGGGALVGGLDKAFRDRTEIPVELLNPLGQLAASKHFEPDFLAGMAPLLGVGVGLALRRVDES